MRLIDADALKKAIDFPWLENIRLGKIINDAPTIDAEPVKHGKWINKRLTKDSIKDIKDGTYGELIGYHDICSVCGFDIDEFWCATGSPNYCPNCGAKMKGQEE